MAAGEGGSIISVSSVAAVRPTEIEAVYGLAKAGLHNMTSMLSRAYAPKVRANVLMPGPFLTDISKAWGDPDVVAANFKETLPLQRAGNPEEIVGAATVMREKVTPDTVPGELAVGV